jgi:hypothetical protein
MFQTKFVDRIKTCYMLVTLQNSCCLYAEKYSAAARLATGHDVIWHMCPACCITKATDTHTPGICNTYCFSMATMVK